MEQLSAKGILDVDGVKPRAAADTEWACHTPHDLLVAWKTWHDSARLGSPQPQKEREFSAH